MFKEQRVEGNNRYTSACAKLVVVRSKESSPNLNQTLHRLCFLHMLVPHTYIKLDIYGNVGATTPAISIWHKSSMSDNVQKLKFCHSHCHMILV